jgi:C-terminal peptidase prc
MRTAAYAILLALALLSAFLSLRNDPLLAALQELSRATALVQSRSVSALSAEELKYSGALGMVSVLDDYSTWHDRHTDTLIRREASGHYGGFGIEIVNYDDTTIIWQVFPASPARAAGLKMGDRLILADTVPLVGLPLDSVHLVLQSVPKQEVDLTVLRPGRTGLLRVPCQRGRIEVGTVRVWAAREHVAYITLEAFNGETSQALERALDTLTRAGADQFILDLRGNPGGLLQAAVECAELFMATAGTVVSVTDAGPTETIDAAPGPYPTQPLVILVDEYSASGSELLAGCLQDWDRAVLLGRPTFGKGFIQNLFPLADESSLRLTIGRYRTPTGRTFYRPDSTSAPDTARYTSLVFGRTLVGGGQIFPDLETREPDCPARLLLWAHSRGLFEYAVELLSHPTLPRLDAGVLEAYWDSPNDDYEDGLADDFEGRAPERLSNDPAWRQRLDRIRRDERVFDRRTARDCLLYVLSRHLARGEADVDFLSEPILHLDPTLEEAMSVLLTPGRYQRLLEGDSTAQSAAASR